MAAAAPSPQATTSRPIKKFKRYFSGPENSTAGFYYLILKEIKVNKWRNPGGWLCALALSFVCLLSGCSIDSDDVPDLMSQRLDLVIKASDKVNPDNQKKPRP